MFGIRGFVPNIINSTSILRNQFGKDLAILSGHTIDKTWVLWNRHSNKWLNEWPVILQINGRRFELFVWNMDQIGLSWDSIDPQAPLFENSNDAGDGLEWRENSLVELVNVLGRRIKRVSAIEYKPSMKILRDSTNPEAMGQEVPLGWLLHGIEFDLDGGCLSLENDLSGLGIYHSRHHGSDFRRVTIT